MSPRAGTAAKKEDTIAAKALLGMGDLKRAAMRLAAAGSCDGK